jgi:hypothetical protein
MQQIEAWLKRIEETWDAKPEREKNLIAMIAVLACLFGVFQLWLGD